ncbi:MAG: DUF4867 family protein [Clostridiales bacterium]|nr:DUF4867 family protein [Clostridiales bacterium]
MVIYEQYSECFRKYGRVIKNIDFTPVVEALEKIEIPADGVVYKPTVDSLEEASAKVDLTKIFGGELKLETGYCAGRNQYLNAVEYHRSSEINIAATDCILLLGQRADITDDFEYDTSKIEAFRIRKGTAVELFATTLHYAPCGIEGSGFMVGVVLPYGTNFDLEEEHIDCLADSDDEDKLLTAKNKWLICHPGAKGEEGHFPGLVGSNIKVDIKKNQLEEL